MSGKAKAKSRRQRAEGKMHAPGNLQVSRPGCKKLNLMPFKKIDPDRNCRIYFQHKKLQRIRTFLVLLMP
jgi:hypothetical protein